MPSDSFHATLKLTTGEEILAEVSLEEEHGQEFFVLQNAITIKETMQVDHNTGVAVSGLVPKKWQLYSSDSMTIIYKQHVVSISELDKFAIEFYSKALIAARLSSPIKRRVDSKDSVGYIGKTKEFRSVLERMYKMSPDVTKD